MILQNIFGATNNKFGQVQRPQERRQYWAKNAG